jgi:hypothetical protein
MPFTVQLLQSSFSLIKHQVFDLLGSLSHFREFLIHFDKFNAILILTNDSNQSLKSTLAVNVLTLVFGLVNSIFYLFHIDDSHLAFVVFDFILTDIIHFESGILKCVHLISQIRLF